ncbi:MAG TPA: hypothetical protein PLQ93_10675, partial [Bacteroidia bacterium]|nr:hypothetical protein [Bacteroidia bacterium]
MTLALILAVGFLPAQDWTLKLMSRVEKEGKALSGASLKLYQGSKLLNQSLTGPDGDFKLEIPANGDFVLLISYPNCNTKKIQVSTLGVPPEISNERYRPSFEIGGVTMSPPLPGIDYSALNQPVVKVGFDPSSKKFDHDEGHTEQMLAALSKIREAEKALIEKQQEACKAGDDALKKKDCDLAKQQYDKAVALIPLSPYEVYPREQLLKVNQCFSAKQDQANKQKAEAEAKAAAEKLAAEKAESERLAREKQAADKAAAESAAKAKAEQDKQAAEKAAAEKAESDRLAREKQAADKAAAESAAKAKAEQDKQVAEKAAAEKAESDRLAREKQVADKTAAAETAKTKAEQDKQAADKLASEKAEADKKDKEKKAADKLAAEAAAKASADEEKAAENKAKAEKEEAQRAEEEKKDREKAGAELAAGKKAEDARNTPKETDQV